MKKIIFTLIILIHIFDCDGQVTFLKSYPFYTTNAKASIVFSWEDGYTMVVPNKNDKYYLSLIRTDLNGDTLWTRNHDMGISSYSLSIGGTSDEDGNIYIRLYLDQGTLIKINSTGQIVWSKNYPFASISTHIQYSNDYLWAIMKRNNTQPNGYYLYKICPVAGDTLWRSNPFGGNGNPTSMAIKQNGEITITTSHRSSSSGSRYVNLNTLVVDSVNFTTVLLPYSYDYTITDSKYIGDELFSIGYIPSVGPIPYDYTKYFRYLIDGTILSMGTKSFGCLASGSYKFTLNNENQFVVLGSCFNYYSYETLLYCISTDWDILWIQRFNNLEYGYNIELCNDGGYIVCGSVWDTLASQEAPCLLKVSSEGILTNINNDQSQPEISVFPNPVSDRITISTTISGPKNMSIFNLKGQLNQSLKDTDNEISLDVSYLEPGVYFVRIISGNRKGLAKFVKK